MAQSRITSLRLPPELDEALREQAERTGESVSDLLRRGALMVLDKCPACGRSWTCPHCQREWRQQPPVP